jgi:hypothetical protein
MKPRARGKAKPGDDGGGGGKTWVIGVLALILVIVLAWSWFSGPGNLTLSRLQGHWVVDTPAWDQTAKRFPPASADDALRWRTCHLTIAKDTITVQWQGLKAQDYPTTSDRAQPDAMRVTLGQDGPTWTLIQDGQRLVILTGIPVIGNVPFVRDTAADR